MGNGCMVPRERGTILFTGATAAVKGEDGLIDPKAIADLYVWLHGQPRNAWTFELDLRPSAEPW